MKYYDARDIMDCTNCPAMQMRTMQDGDWDELYAEARCRYSSDFNLYDCSRLEQDRDRIEEHLFRLGFDYDKHTDFFDNASEIELIDKIIELEEK